MKKMILAFTLLMGLMSTYGEIVHNHLANASNPDKDMYVIHATVYEVGILTNKTDNKTTNYNTTGSQESVTFYQTNGTDVDLSGIPKPLLTNVTAQSMIGVAPVGNGTNASTWGSIDQLTSFSNMAPSDHSDKLKTGNLKVASVDSSNFLRKLFKRDASGPNPVKVVKGTAMIPSAVGLQSISLPPLLTLNNKLSGIPVPIPNTAVVNYAKVNTLVRSP